jgi:hypothetical protein
MKDSCGFCVGQEEVETAYKREREREGKEDRELKFFAIYH